MNERIEEALEEVKTGQSTIHTAYVLEEAICKLEMEIRQLKGEISESEGDVEIKCTCSDGRDDCACRV